ncbi:MAG: high frequency lysogenization protein HflD [Saccharospirillaceae bacterium]|nr:high frequency lysogenization protein HflD [Pseudomonadales bacterium]NRB79503.1 high frequency lysogenization protein HflD [Saccharospirillaceae bacterium]
MSNERALALAGVFQSAYLVERLATTGKMDDLMCEQISKGLLNMNPEHTMDIYGGVENLSEGIKQIQLHLGNGESHGHIMKYAMSLLHIESKIRNDKTRFNEISKNINQVQNQADYFASLTHESVIAGLAKTYKDSISSLSFSIKVLGNSEYLRDERIADKIRATLLFGVRSAILWHQLGGHRWHFLFYRASMVKQVQALR